MRAAMQGFALLEMLMALAIAAVLAGVAWPSFQQHAVRGKRQAAQVQMLDIATRQQQFLLTQQRYAAQNELERAGYRLPEAVARDYRYQITLGTGTWPTYQLAFIPHLTSAQHADGALTLHSDGRREPEGRW